MNDYRGMFRELYKDVKFIGAHVTIVMEYHTEARQGRGFETHWDYFFVYL